MNADNLHRPGQPEAATLAQHGDANWTPEPQFFVETSNLPVGNERAWTIGFKDVTAPTNMRTMIAAALPLGGYGNTLPIVRLDNARDSALLLANFNAFALDYVARQKVQGQHLNWFTVEQLPVIPPAGYDRRFGAMTAREIVAREVLRLTYTAHDMAPFARDMLVTMPELAASWQSHAAVGPAPQAGRHSADSGIADAIPGPHAWDEQDRRQRRARLDALYFHLYGLTRDEADYILSTFPIVRRQDEAAFEGRYLTRDLILGQMAALAAGDTEAIIAPR